MAVVLRAGTFPGLARQSTPPWPSALAEMEALDALCCTPPPTIDGMCAGIRHIMAVEDAQGNGAARAYLEKPPGLATPTGGLARQPPPPWPSALGCQHIEPLRQGRERGDCLLSLRLLGRQRGIGGGKPRLGGSQLLL